MLVTGKNLILIKSGNRDYSLSVEDPETLGAEVDLSGPNGMGNIVLTGKQKEV